jgi:CHAT domain-containing protein
MSSPERARPQDFVDLEIRIFPNDAAGYPAEITLGGQREFKRGYVSSAILPWVSSGVPAEDGQKLFDVLLADQVLRDAWNTSREAAPQRRIRLRIDAEAAELHALPWELLQRGPVMLSAQTDTPFSRYLPIELDWSGAVEERPIRVLVVISNPDDLHDKYDLAPVDVALERENLEAAFDSVGADELQADFLDAPATPERLEDDLGQGYHVLHFVGHGAFSRRRASSALYMQDEQGLAQRVLDDELVGMLARQGVQPRLVFLAACQSATRSMADAFLGLGPKLVGAGVPAVVAMQDVVTVETARKFSATFYRQLLAHDQVDLAVNEARSTLLTAGRADAAVPVLFMRLRDGLLFAPTDAADSDTSKAQIHIGQINVQDVKDSTVSITTTTGK